MTWVRRSGTAVLGALALAMIGCGTPGPPQPPSLNLPARVNNLAAVRTGNQVALTWTMPKHTTDKVFIKAPIAVHVCRIENTEPCASAGNVSVAPGTSGSFTETLPASLASGSPRSLRYFVELKNKSGRSAGLSNAAVVLAGQAPPPVNGLTAEVRKGGVALHWAAESQPASIRLHRTLLSVPPKTHAQPGLMSKEQEPTEQNLLIESDAGRAIDQNISFGQKYRYTAQRVARVQADGQMLELASAVSEPVQVEAVDIFPPAVPTGLVAVATAPDGGAQAAIDLNWHPNAESDLAGYIVYRRDGNGDWQRISPAQPQLAPAFHDIEIQPGHTYTYAVSAVDKGGHESARSAGTQETAPQP